VRQARGKWALEELIRRRGRNLRRATWTSLEGWVGTSGDTLKGSETLWEEPWSMKKFIGGRGECAKTSGLDVEYS
jgi:hypothetical protein